MNKRMLTVLLALFLMVSTIQSMIGLVKAVDTDKMYIEPTGLNFTPANASVGTKFNATVWVDMTTPINSWQLFLVYDRSMLQGLRCEYTGNGKSQWSGTLPTDSVIPTLEPLNDTHGYALHGEVLKQSAEKEGVGSLAFIEFNITKTPTAGQTLSSELRLDVSQIFNSYVMDNEFNEVPLTFGKAVYTFSSGQPPPANYTLNITTTAGGTTSPTPGKHSYQPGTAVSVTALPNANFQLDHWELDGAGAGSANPISVTMNANHTLHANFTAVTPAVNYTLTITATAGGTTNPAPGKYTRSSGTAVSVTAVPNANFQLDHWELDGAGAGSANPISVTMNANHTLHANFTAIPPAVNYTLTITATAGGTTSPVPGKYSYKAGTSVSVQATPDATHILDHWELDAANIGATNPVSVAMSKNHTLNAVFAIKPEVNYTLTITATTGGTTSPSVGARSYESGTNVPVTAIHDTNYILDHWELDGSNIGASNPTTVTMDKAHTLRAVFVYVPPPPAGPVRVQWANLTDPEHLIGNPLYPFGGQYHSGQYPLWKNFTIINGETENIVYISVKYPETTPEFKPSKYKIVTIPDDQCWIIQVNTDDRLIEFTAQDEGVKANGGCAIVSIEFIEGPTAEDGIFGHEFAITATGISCYGETFYLREYIDKTPPEVKVTFPNATNSGGLGYAFVKKPDGSIWVQMPNCTNKKINWLWINGTASDTYSGINRVEIWINGTYMGDARLSKPVGSKEVSWWWSVDPTVDTRFWKDECWFYVVARAYDNSVNNEKIIPAHGRHPRLPQTNSRDTEKNWFFWIGSTGPNVIVQDRGKPLSWVPGNGRVDINGTTGFYPNGRIDLYLINRLYGIRILLANVTANNYGRFFVTINHLPEVPRKPLVAERWNITAIDIKGNWGCDLFAIVPWITYEGTLDLNDPATWTTTLKGYVGDTIEVHGHGFLPSRQARWDPYSDVYVRIVYTDVAPLEKWDSRNVFNGTGQFNYDRVKWYPRLSDVVLNETKTDANGYWSARITIPQSFGGLHAIYAYEFRIATDPLMPLPNPSPDKLVRSGWIEYTDVDEEEQAVIFDVWPTLTITPSAAITDQYVTITGEGLPLPRYYKLWRNGNLIADKRNWSLVLDFGPFTQWVWEAKRIRNNELDLGWANPTWYPFAYYSPDPAAWLDSPVWKGKLTSVTKDFVLNKYEFHIGSKYLKVPMLAPSEYDVTVYYFDKKTETFVHDHDATTTVEVIKDPLHINVDVGKIHLPSELVNVFAQVDVDGIAADATGLTLELYKGETLVQTLSYKKINRGAYVATFTCPAVAGDYFIKATADRSYETFSLHGSAIAGFTVNPTINDINAKLIALEGKVATLQTDMGQVRLDLSTANAKIIDIEGKMAMIQTKMGTLWADVSAIDGKIVSIEGRTATIETTLGEVKANLQSVNAVITAVNADVVTIHTAVGDLQTKLENLNAIVSIENDIATIQTDLGEIKGKVTNIEGNSVEIKTDIGNITTKADTIQGNVGLQPITIGLSLFAALAAIAVAVLILRKVYLE